MQQYSQNILTVLLRSVLFGFGVARKEVKMVSYKRWWLNCQVWTVHPRDWDSGWRGMWQDFSVALRALLRLLVMNLNWDWGAWQNVFLLPGQMLRYRYGVGGALDFSRSWFFHMSMKEGKSKDNEGKCKEWLYLWPMTSQLGREWM